VSDALHDAIQAEVAKYPDRRSAIISALRLAQEAYGWLSPPALEEVARCLDLTPGQCQAVASFYDMFFLEPVGRHLVEVCTNISCSLVGAGAVVEAFQRELGVPLGATTPDGAITLRSVECLGGCGWAPVVSVDHAYHEYSPPLPGAVLLDFEGERRSIRAYLAADGYAAAKRYASASFDDVVRELKESGLRGRGGAGFPTGMKVSFIGPGERFLVVNADESEPGTFKDRELMLRDPHALIEGAIILCNAIGARRGYIYIRGEYATEARVLGDALAEAYQHGFLGQPLPGAPGPVDLYLHRGAGAYICGEETALLSSLNGERGQPTAKPPFPAVSGAWHSPTLLNNVETVATVPHILRVGAAAYAAVHTEQTTGTRLMSLSGRVNRPGNYELPVTASFRDLIETHGGGMIDGASMKCFIPGGSSSPILMPSQLDVQIAVETCAAAGTMAGSGGVIVIDDQACAVGLALRIADFYRHESCGKCTPCREGTRWTVDLLKRIESGEARAGEIDLVLDICDRMEGKCLCPLGDACAMPVRSIITHFRHEFQDHLDRGVCPAGAADPFGFLYPGLKRPLPLVSV
jgi:NADH-quinone oxidoreductase subunit F